MLEIKSEKSPIFYNGKIYGENKKFKPYRRSKNEFVSAEGFSNAPGEDASNSNDKSSPASNSNAKSSPAWMGGLTNLFNSAAPLAQSVGALVGGVEQGIKAGQSQPKDGVKPTKGSDMQSGSSLDKNAEKGMGTATKIIIFAVVAGLAGFVIYKATKKK